MSLTGKTLAGSYKDILQVDNSNSGITTSVKQIKDGEGTTSCAYRSDDSLDIRPENARTDSAFRVLEEGGDIVFEVDTHHELVKASGHYVNTQYAHFGATSTASANYVDDTHHAIPLNMSGYAALSYPPAFGTSTDPATTFTTADGNGTRGSDLVPVLWRLPDAISIDSVTSIEGADTATGDTTRMHLFSYTFTSGSTSALSAGTLLAHNTDVTNAGSEQAYLSTWTVDSTAVAANKVILAFFKSDSINSDYSVSITVKYHLT